MSSAHRRSTAEEFALLVDSVQDYAIFLLSLEGEIDSWNRGAARIMGYTEDEALGRHFSLFYTPDDIASRKPQRELEVAAREGRVEDEGWRVRKDGTRFWANTIITALLDDDGELRGFGKVTRDMTERRKAEEELRQSADIFQLLVSSVREYAIFMLDPDGRIATWNSGAQAIKGYAPEEIIGRHFSTFYSEEDVRNGVPQRALATARERGSFEAEGWRVRKDGSRFWANVVITAIRDAHGQLRGFAKVTRDMTERKKAQEIQRALLEAEASYRAAEEASRAKDEFLMTLSHELRTPMTAILGWARMLPAMSPADPLFHEAVESIAAGAQLQSRLIDDILDVSRVVAGKLRLAPEPVDVARVVMNAVDAVRPSAAAKQIRLTTAFAPGLGSMIVDPARIQQVVWNLVSNAVKFTPRDGEVQIAALRAASHVEISVTDTGEGIDPEFLPHIFEPFRQAETPHTRTHGGLGLGLSIVRYIVEAHGGTVEAHSEGRGQGAKFTVTLPIRATVSQGEPASAGVNGQALLHGGRLQGLEIVVVDDDVEARKMLAAVLRSAGASVEPLDTAAAALEAIDRRRPDLVITDIAMPETDGYAFVRALREREQGRELPVVAFSAFPAATEERDRFALYLPKPIDPFRLVDEIARVAARASAR